MKKIVFIGAATLLALNLQAKTYATVNGSDITDKDLNAIIQKTPAAQMIMAQGGVKALPAAQVKRWLIWQLIINYFLKKLLPLVLKKMKNI